MTTTFRGMAMAAAAIALVAPLAACNSGTDSAGSSTMSHRVFTKPVAPSSATPATTRTTTTSTSPTSTSTTTSTTTASEQPDHVIHVTTRAGFMVGPTHAACLLNAAGVTCADGTNKPLDIPGVKCPAEVAVNASVLNSGGEVGGACGGDVAYVAEPGDAAWAAGLGLRKVHGAPVLTTGLVLVDDASSITCKVSLLNDNWLDCAYEEGVIRMTVKPTGVSFDGATPMLLSSTVHARPTEPSGVTPRG